MLVSRVSARAAVLVSLLTGTAFKSAGPRDICSVSLEWQENL
jgi:hypothetical protein